MLPEMYNISITLLASPDNKNGSCAVREVKKPSPQIYFRPILEGYTFDRAILVTVLGEILDQEKSPAENPSGPGYRKPAIDHRIAIGPSFSESYKSHPFGCQDGI